MPSVLDIATYLLAQRPGVGRVALQTLLYYVDAWHLVETGELGFAEPLEAWPLGPVSPVVASPP